MNSLYAAVAALSGGASNRGRTGTPLCRKAADFKSAVSTNFTIEACNSRIVLQKLGKLSPVADLDACEQAAAPARPMHRGMNGAGEESRTLDLNLGKVALYQLSYSRLESGGAGRSRTDLHGFAIRCITALLPRQNFSQPAKTGYCLNKKGKLLLPFSRNLEREKSLELSTSTLARLRSTN